MVFICKRILLWEHFQKLNDLFDNIFYETYNTVGFYKKQFSLFCLIYDVNCDNWRLAENLKRNKIQLRGRQ